MKGSDFDIQSSNAKNPHNLQPQRPLHLQPPQRRQGRTQQHEIRQHIHPRHNHPQQINLDAFRLDGGVPSSSYGYALEDCAQHHDAAVCDDEDPDRVEQDAELAAGEDARVEEEGADFHGGNGGGVEYFGCEDAL